jgi:Tol biopolymer transport system component
VRRRWLLAGVGVVVAAGVAAVVGLAASAGVAGGGSPPGLARAMAAYWLGWTDSQRGQEHTWIMVADLAGRQRHEITPRPGTAAYPQSGFPSWSPDGSRLAFFVDESFRRDGLYSANRDGSGRRRVFKTACALADAAPVWSPDGRQIAFVANPTCSLDSAFWVYVVDADGAHPRRLLQAAGTAGVTWSPDGKSLLTFGSALSRVAVEGAHRLVLSKGRVDDAAWSPDGSRIAYAGNCRTEIGGNTFCRAYVMRSDGSGRHLLSQREVTGGLYWVEGGNNVLYTQCYGQALYLADPATGRARLLHRGASTQNPDGYRVLGVSHDGQTIAYEWAHFPPPTGGEGISQVRVETLDGRWHQRVVSPPGWGDPGSVYLP